MADFLDRLYSPEGEAVRRTVPVACAIYETYGLWPTGSEAHIAEFYNHFLTPATHGGADYGLTSATPPSRSGRPASPSARAGGWFAAHR